MGIDRSDQWLQSVRNEKLINFNDVLIAMFTKFINLIVFSKHYFKKMGFHSTHCFTLFHTICYFFSIILSIDLLWTLQKAKESCKNPDWVHLNTTPLNTLWRLSGLAIGMMRYRELADSQSIPRTLPKRVFSAICSIVFNFSLFPALQTAIYQWSGESLYVFYACSSFHFMLIPVCLMFFTKFV